MLEVWKDIVTGSLVGQISKNRAWKHLNPALAQEAEE